MKRCISIILTLCMMLSCVSIIQATQIGESTVTTVSNTKRGANSDDGNVKWNMAVYGDFCYYFAYDVSALAGSYVTKAEFKFKQSDAAATLDFYEITTPVNEWGYKTNPDADYDPLFPTDPAPAVSETAFASVANDGTGTADLTSYIKGKIADGAAMIQFAIKNKDAAIQLGALASSVPTLEITTVKPQSTTTEISNSKRGANNSETDAKWNMAITGNNYYYFAYNVSEIGDVSVDKAEFVYRQSTADATLNFYEITSAVDTWGYKTDLEANYDPLFPADPAPTVSTAAFASAANDGTGIADLTAFVKAKVEAGETVIQFAVNTSSATSRISLGSLGSDEPILKLTTSEKVEAPVVTVTSPLDTTFAEGSDIAVAATVTDSQGISSVKITVDETELAVTSDGDSYSAQTGVLGNGQHTIKIVAENTYGYTTEKTITVLVGYQQTVTEISNIKRGSNSKTTDENHSDVKWNMAVFGDKYYYLAYDVSALKDYTLEKAEFKFKVSDADETLNFYEITTPVDEWGYKNDATADYDPLFPADPAPTVSTTAFASVKNDATGIVDLTSYVEEKIAAGETVIQFAVNSNQYRVSLGALGSDEPKLQLTTKSLLRPTVTPAEDYSYVTPGAVDIGFTVDGNGAEIAEVTATVDGEVAEIATGADGYTIPANLAEGEHTVVISATNNAGSKRVVTWIIKAVDYEVTDRSVTVDNGTITGSAVIKSYTGVLDKAVAIIAVYDENNTLIDRSFTDYSALAKGETNVSASIAMPEGAATAKLFIWYNVESLLPLCDVTPAQVR